MPRIAYKPLCSAIYQGGVKELEQLAKGDPAAAQHWKPIMDAAFTGNAACIEVLVSNGADVNVKAGTGAKHTPLTRLCQYHKTIPKHEGHPAALNQLLAYGADPTLAAGPLVLTPLGYAAMGPLDELIEILVDKLQPLDAWSASLLCDITRLNELVQEQALTRTDSEKRTPLHYVCMSGLHKDQGNQAAISCVDFLLNQGIEIDAAQPIVEGDEIFHATALWYAVSWQGNLELTKHLLTHGASPNPAVFSSLFHGDVEICELLDEFGADWNLIVGGASPLIDMMKWKRSKLVPWLLEHGADPSIKDHDGLSALDHARNRKVRQDVIDLLIEHGA
ncbi:MAG: ankyrin repeat domain-containing protein [Gammaproteobacteria bacterium]|nr:ankyrin repeat domain-containing protein [Gammaproteobacteria bacterium]